MLPNFIALETNLAFQYYKNTYIYVRITLVYKREVWNVSLTLASRVKLLKKLYLAQVLLFHWIFFTLCNHTNSNIFQIFLLFFCCSFGRIKQKFNIYHVPSSFGSSAPCLIALFLWFFSWFFPSQQFTVRFAVPRLFSNGPRWTVRRI